MKQLETTVTIDWLRYTAEWGQATIRDLDGNLGDMLRVKAAERATMPLSAFALTGVALKPLYNYNTRLEMTCGSLSYHDTDYRQKIMVDIPGQGCEKYRQMGIKDRDMLEYVWKTKAHPTRIDIALDYYGEANPQDMIDAFELGFCNTEIEKIVQVTGKGAKGKIDGNTAYFGAPTSDRRVRVYDKAAQMGLGRPWTRIEATIKHDAAERAIAAFVGRSVADTGRAIIRSIIDTPKVEWWHDATTGPAIEMQHGARSISNTDKWLLTVVKDVLERRLRETTAEGDFLIRDTFYGLIERVRKETFD